VTDTPPTNRNEATPGGVTDDRAEAWSPLPEQESAAQVEAVLALLGEPGKRVIDLGAGGGRVAGPLVERGHRVLTIDRDPAAARACEAAGAEARTLELADAGAALGFKDGPADAALLLGMTLMEFVDPRAALSLFRRAREAVRPGGWLALDGALLDVWEDVAEGAWATGVSEDGGWQMIWAPGDAVVAIRRGERVDPGDWEIGKEDRLYRLWTRGELALLAEASGWGAPEPVDFRTLLRLERRA